MNGDRAVAKHETPLQRAQEWLALTPRERAARRMQATEIITLLSDSLSAIEIGRASIHAQFRNVSRDADGNCQCAYCRGDAGQLGELAADYELRLAGETYRREAAEDALALRDTQKCATCVHLTPFELAPELNTCPVVNIRIHTESAAIFGCNQWEAK